MRTVYPVGTTLYKPDRCFNGYTINPIESTFATVRLRTRRTKGCGSTAATLTMTYKLGLETQQHWRRLNGSPRSSKENGS